MNSRKSWGEKPDYADELEAERDALRARVEKLEGELSNIANAKRFDRERFGDDTDFADWAQSRARAGGA